MADELHTDRLVLRGLRAADADDVHAYRSDAEIARFQSWEPQSLAEVRAYLASQCALRADEPGWYQLAIVERAADRVVGDVGIHILEHDPRQVELGFTLARAAQGRGLAAEAVRAVVGHVFALGKHRVIASTDPRNARSIALLRRLGFRLEAHHHESLWFKGAWADDLIFALLRRDWPEEQAASRGAFPE